MEFKEKTQDELITQYMDSLNEKINLLMIEKNTPKPIEPKEIKINTFQYVISNVILNIKFLILYIIHCIIGFIINIFGNIIISEIIEKYYNEIIYYINTNKISFIDPQIYDIFAYKSSVKNKPFGIMDHPIKSEESKYINKSSDILSLVSYILYRTNIPINIKNDIIKKISKDIIYDSIYIDYIDMKNVDYNDNYCDNTGLFSENKTFERFNKYFKHSIFDGNSFAINNFYYNS